jgi:glutaredoxin
MDAGNGDGHSAKVVLYTLGGCGACSLARRILRGRGIDFATAIAAALRAEFEAELASG